MPWPWVTGDDVDLARGVALRLVTAELDVLARNANRARGWLRYRGVQPEATPSARGAPEQQRPSTLSPGA